MRICTKGFSYIEVVICIALFAQMAVMVWSTVMTAINMNKFNQVAKNVDMELYSAMINSVWAYIRNWTAINYWDCTNASHSWSCVTPEWSLDSFDRTCKPNKIGDTPRVDDRLSLFQDVTKTKTITFAVEYNPQARTSRLVYRKDDWPWYYLTSENVFITCFLVSLSPNPYATWVSENTKDIQPYVQIELSWRYQNNLDNLESNTFYYNWNDLNSYRALFTLRNYYY